MLLALCLLFTAVLVAAEWWKRPGIRALSKTLASACFVGAAAVGGALTGGPGVVLFVGLVLSMIGDLCLLSRAKRWFIAGLAAFLLAHVTYLVAFLLLGVAPAGFLAILPGLVVMVPVWRWMGPLSWPMDRAVAAYMAVITLMVVCALAAVLHTPSPLRGLLLVAAVLFYLSDLCVARERFVQSHPINRTLGLPLYYGAQVLFAWGATQV